MRLGKTHLTMIGMLAASALALGACSGNNGNGDTDAGTDTDAGGGGGFEQPADSVPLYFTIDATDRAGMYQDEDLEWKGSFTYDKETRILSFAADWAGGTGPYAPLYDDGPWTAGGHEPEGAVAGDNKFGIAAFLFPIPTEDLEIQYGAQTKPAAEGEQGNWIWVGDNGSVIVPANGTDAVTAPGLKLLPMGNVDVKLTLDTTALGGSFTFDAATQTITIKGQFNDWGDDAAYDDGTHGDETAGDGIYTYVLSEADAGRSLVLGGTEQEFIWNIVTDGTAAEYKDSNGDALTDAVAGWTKGPDDADWVTATVGLKTGGMGGQNTYIAIP